MRRKTHSDSRQILYAVTDTIVQIVSPTKRYFLIVDPLVGIAVNYRLVLPDARTIRTGTPFVFENQSSNFIGVYNSDSSTWHRVSPRATLYVTLKSQATAAGVWQSFVFDPAVVNPAYGLSSFLDFCGPVAAGANYSDPGLYFVISGAAASISVNTTGSRISAGRQGSLMAYAGTAAAGYANVYSAHIYLLLGSGCRAVETSQNLNAISTVADEYIARFGFGDNITGGAHAEGAYLLYDRLAAGIVNWQMRTVKTTGGAASTQTDTGVAPIYNTDGSAWQKLRVELNSLETRADFFIDNVLVSPSGGLTTVPGTTVQTVKMANIGITGSAYASVARLMRLEYLRIQSYPTTLR